MSSTKRPEGDDKSRAREGDPTPDVAGGPYGKDPRDVKGGHDRLTRDDAARAGGPSQGHAPPQDLSGGGTANETVGVGGDKDATSAG